MKIVCNQIHSQLSFKVCCFNPFNGVTDEICNIFVALALNRTDMKPEVSEEFGVSELHYEKFCEMIKAATIWDGMTLAAFALFDQRKHEFLLTTLR